MFSERLDYLNTSFCTYLIITYINQYFDINGILITRINISIYLSRVLLYHENEERAERVEEQLQNYTLSSLYENSRNNIKQFMYLSIAQ